PLPRRDASTLDHLIKSMPRRTLPLIYDNLIPDNVYRLSRTLKSFVPEAWFPQWKELPPRNASFPLPTGSHLVYFNPAISADRLLPDGTDPLQSPGPPFVRRMWAGGYYKINPTFRFDLHPMVQARRWVCMESIRDIQIKGLIGDEKIFVGIERRIAPVKLDFSITDGDQRNLLWAAHEDSFNGARIIERRNIVFMTERSPETAAALAVQINDKILKPPHKPDFFYTITPTPSLLFRYSALTFNAHSIHLDPEYCRKIEGHRNLLVHGPLTFTLLSLLLENHLKCVVNPGNRKEQHILQIQYRNLAPLYVDEPLTLCGKELSPEKYELWAQTPAGGIAVKATAIT
ncbi:hypothetical protein M501DRAFT_919687, partial [Patellaria atrata CBS 101060]